MAKQTKVMDVHDGGCHLEVIRINDRKEMNPYRVRMVWMNGSHRKQVAKYGDLVSVLYQIKEFYLEGADTLELWERIKWFERWN